MQRIVISVICATLVLASCGRTGTEMTKSDCNTDKSSSHFSLNHKRANKKSTNVLSGKKQMKKEPLKTGSKQEYISISEDVEAGPEMDNSTNPGHWGGVYHDYQSNTLKISDVNMKDKTFHFSLSLVTNKECVGEINGKAKVINETPQAQFIQDPQLGPCEMTFEFDGYRSIQIKEIECMDANGNQCIFEGSYKK